MESGGSRLAFLFSSIKFRESFLLVLSTCADLGGSDASIGCSSRADIFELGFRWSDFLLLSVLCSTAKLMQSVKG